MRFTDPVGASIQVYSNPGSIQGHEISARDGHIVRDSAQNLKAWNNELTSKQQNLIRELVEDVSANYYVDADW